MPNIGWPRCNTLIRIVWQWSGRTIHAFDEDASSAKFLYGNNADAFLDGHQLARGDAFE